MEQDNRLSLGAAVPKLRWSRFFDTKLSKFKV